ncbi:Rieske (2Fe-2S) protein [Streptomyces polygonati]|uniref:Rieske (2Fe-2S) protein n=1 Tax=Streptomyces polygonati TaxID=1617087 RepID=A0ABV8HQQ8_9ACTN
MSGPGPGTGQPHEAVVEALPQEWIRVTVGDRSFELAAACPHRKGRLVHGFVNTRTLRITCPLHRSSFDLATGLPRSGPSCGPVPTRPCAQPDGGRGEPE